MAKPAETPIFENDYDIFAVGGERVELAGLSGDVYALTTSTEAEMALNPEEIAIQAASDMLLARMIDELDLRSQYVMAERYGFNGQEATLEEVGDALGLTKERIRQIQNVNLAKLRSMEPVREVAYFHGYEPGQALPFGLGVRHFV